MLTFKEWLETTTTNQNLIFLDMDETLLHSVPKQNAEQDKLKATTSKKMRARRQARNEFKAQMYAEAPVVGDRYIVARPHLEEALEEIKKLGKLHVLTAASPQYAVACANALGIKDYFDEIFSSRTMMPINVWDRNWVLVDDLNHSAMGVIEKIRLLGPGPVYDLEYPPEMVERTIQIKPWMIDDPNDRALLDVISDIRRVLSSAG